MDINTVNINYQNLLNVKNKLSPNIFNKALIESLNTDNELDIRKTDEYYQCMNIILDNMNEMYESIKGRNFFNDSDEDDLETYFSKIYDKQYFITNFFVLNNLTIKNIIYSEIDIKFQAVSDFFTLILKKEAVEISMKRLTKELNDILDIKKDNIEEKLDIIDEIIEKIGESLKTSEAEKKNYGEVFTAFVLINMMLDTLPKEVWVNPYLKWLDPANGYGNFPAVIVQRLMKTLADVKIPETNLQDPKLRFKWIMEKMIYVCDINKRNMKIFVELFDREGKLGIKLNFFRGSFFDEKFKFESKMKEWCVRKFDIIVGNPPYQDINKNGRKQPHSHNLWSKFVNKSVSLLIDDGYLLFITPDSWRSPSNKILQLFKVNNLIYTNFDISNYFQDIGSTFSYWLLQKKKYNGKTIIDNIEVNMNKVKYIPNGGSLSLSIHSKTIMSDNEKFNVLCDTTSNHSSSKKKNLSKEKINLNKYKLYHTNAQSFWTTTKSKNHDDKKIFFTISGYYNPIYDNGNLSTSEICLYILVENDEIAKSLLNILNSKLYKFLALTGKWSGFLNKDVLRNFPKLELNKYWTNEEIYNYFNLTYEEIQLIEDTIIDKPEIIKDVEDSNFNINNLYEYTGKSKNINSTEVELVKILKTSFQIKDTIGNVSTVKKNTLKNKE